MRARQHIGAAVAVFQRDIVLFGGAQLLAQLIQAVFIVTLFYYVSRLLHVGRFGSSDAYFGFVVAGLVVLRLMIATLGVVPTALRQELVAGTFERLVVSPFGPLASILSMMLFPLLNAIVGAVFIVGFAALAFGLTISWPSALLALPLGVLAGIAFAPVALIMCAGVIAIKQRATGSALAIALITLIAGFYYPTSLLPVWIRWAADVQPFTPALDLMRHTLLGTPLGHSVAFDLVRVVGFGAVLGALGAAAVAGAVELGRRRGTITEY